MIRKIIRHDEWFLDPFSKINLHQFRLYAYIRATYFFEIKFHDANNSNDVNHNTVNQKKKKKNQETTFIKYEYENISTERIVWKKNFFEKGQSFFPLFQTYRDLFRDERCAEVLLGDAREQSIAAIDSGDRSNRGQRQA